MSPSSRLIASILLCCGISRIFGAGQPADLVLRHGKIVTADPSFSIRSAVAVRGDRIVAVGSENDAASWIGPNTEVLDLRGKLVLPGLIDSHTHPTGAAMTEFDHPIPDMESMSDVLDYFKKRAAVTPRGRWIVLQQVFITRLREQRYPTRAELDAAVPNHPAAFRTGPDASFNSLALRETGIDRNFKIPAGAAGRIEKDKNGEPTGILRNISNYVKIPSVQPKDEVPTTADRLNRLRQLFADYNSVGLTTICDRDASSSAIALYRELRDRAKLNVRVAISHDIGTQGPIGDIQKAIRAVGEHPLFKNPDDYLRIVGIKVFLDGGMLTGSAYMREPWGVSSIYGIDDPEYRGILFIPKDRLRVMVQTAVESGLQFTAHSVGDGAVHLLLDVYDEVNRETPIRNTHPCITHSNFMSKEAVDQAARLGVAVDIQPAWLYLDTRTLVKQFGYDRLRWFQPLHSLFAQGVLAGGGSDHMQKIGSLRSINPYNPFLGMWVAITRRARWFDGRLHSEEALTRPQAIQFYTINNAKLLGLEQKVGSIEPGKLADFVVLDRDLLTCPEDQIRNATVERTYSGGRLVYLKRKS